MRTRSATCLLVAFVASTVPSWAATLPASCGNEKTIIDVTTHKHASASTAPEAGKAKVIFIEQADAEAAPVTTRVAIDGAWLGGDHGNSYFVSAIPPGEHHVCVDWQLKRRMIKDDPQFDVFNAEGGRVYYFRVRVGWRPNYSPVPYAEPHMDLSLMPLNEDEGHYLIQNLKLSTFTQKE